VDPSGDVALRNPITGIAGCCARAASGHAAAPPDELAPFHGLPSSGREPHITTPLRENAAMQCGKIAHRMAEMGQNAKNSH